jgi:sulfur carrier protein
LAQLLQQLNYAKAGFAVALNQQVIPHAQYTTTTLQAEDKIEIVTAMQGG